MTDQPELPSLGLLVEAVRDERAERRAHLDAMDSKAGIVLGFAGVVAALSDVGTTWVLKVGVGVAVIAALLALASYWPQKFRRLNLDALGTKYLNESAQETRRAVLGTLIHNTLENDKIEQRKVKRLKWAFGSLALAIVLVATGTIMNGDTDVRPEPAEPAPRTEPTDATEPASTTTLAPRP